MSNKLNEVEIKLIKKIIENGGNVKTVATSENVNYIKLCFLYKFYKEINNLCDVPSDDDIISIYKICPRIVDVPNKLIESGFIKCSERYIKYILEKNNIEKEKCGRKKKYSIDENYFEIIDSEDKAYFLGFIYADGCVYERKKGNSIERSLSIKLNEKDIEILEAFKFYSKSNHPIAKSTVNTNGIVSNIVGIQIYNSKIFLDLLDKGCFPNKTCKIKFPDTNTLPHELIPHFIRGYFDGDGCITGKITTDGQENIAHISNPICSFESNEEFLDGIRLNLPTEITLNNNNKYYKRREGCRSSSFRIQSVSNVLLFYDFIYNDSTIFLNRKKDKFLLIKNFNNVK